MFQSTRSHGARRLRDSSPHKKVLFQSTRSHGARHNTKRNQRMSYEVSIHALAWSATCVVGDEVDTFPVSIHALAWSATGLVDVRTAIFGSFNPRARMERDPLSALSVFMI